MSGISREFKVGIYVIISIGLFIWGYNYLKGHNLFKGRSISYFTEYNNVQGLNTASLVTVNGYEVGKVTNISFSNSPEKKGHLLVEFSVENDFYFSKKSIAKIYSASLMGGKYLAIIPSYEGKKIEPGDYLKGEIESDIFSSVGKKLNPLQAKLERVIVSADSLLVNLNEVLDINTITKLKKSINSFEKTMSNTEKISKKADSMIAENKQVLKNTLKNAEKITENFSKISDTLTNANIGLLARKIEVTVDNLNYLTTGIRNGEGTIGKLMNDNDLYNNLSNASKELEELLRNIKLHPKRFVHFSLFGKKEKNYDETKVEHTK